jgi:hypothetical protein
MKEETEFYLPIGLTDSKGKVHRKGVMRAVTAADELELENADGVKFNDRQRDLELLARLIVSLGSLPNVNSEVLEDLYEADFIYLQMLFNSMNQGDGDIEFSCPHCGKRDKVHLPTTFKESPFKGGFKENRNFTLPHGSGLKPEIGTKVKGSMRMVRCRDFLVLHRDSRARTTTTWFYIGLLTRCVNKLGEGKSVDNSIIGKLQPPDFSFLVDLFNELNNGIVGSVKHMCSCGKGFDVELSLPGEV